MGSTTNLDVILSNERGLTENEWLISRHTYSFGRYYNLKRLNFGTLRVFNDDVIQPGRGFGTHPHDNMEIITIVLEGALQHKDSKGNEGVLKAGDVQRMTAGSGIEHSEFNASKKRPLRLLQIWIYPEERDLIPAYEQKHFSAEALQNQFKKIVGKSSASDELTIHQDASFYLGHFDANQDASHQLKSPKHGAYLFVVDGMIQLGDRTFNGGDSVQITGGDKIELMTKDQSKLLLIEVGINTL